VTFARCADEVRIYRPDDMYEKVITITHEKWEEHKTSYGDRSDIALYDDTVNAAWQRMGFSDTIDRASARKLKIEIGHYFPRIWRGVYDMRNYYCYNSVSARTIFGSAYIGANVAASSIFDAVESLFRYVEPAKENLSAFGHKIREVLILTCMEVESAWRSVLEANSTKRKFSYTTRDYSSLLEPMRLKEWSVALKDYPDLGLFSPFYSWDQSRATKSLPWYDAYNAVKHHREERFKLANLGNLIDAAAALHIMQSAQFGPEMYHNLFGNNRSPFSTVKHAVHDLSDIYVPDFIRESEMSAEQYFK
jgi:hypothetical protein